MKKLICLLLVLCLLGSVAAAAAEPAQTDAEWLLSAMADGASVPADRSVMAQIVATRRAAASPDPATRAPGDKKPCWCSLQGLVDYTIQNGIYVAADKEYDFIFCYEADGGVVYYGWFYDTQRQELNLYLYLDGSNGTRSLYLTFDARTGGFASDAITSVLVYYASNATCTLRVPSGGLNAEAFTGSASLNYRYEGPASLNGASKTILDDMVDKGCQMWNIALQNYVGISLGDLGFTAYAAPTGKDLGNHDYADSITTEPTPTSEGVRTYTCAVCGRAYTERIPALGYPFEDVLSSSFCWEPVRWAAEREITLGVDETHFAPSATCTRGQIVTFLWRAMGSPAPTVRENPFTDVKPGSFCEEAVLWAVEKEITKGVNPTTFGTSRPCTRGQAVTFLYRAEGSPVVTGECKYTDVASGSFCRDAVIWADALNITNGTSATAFSPERACTRGQIVTFLYRDLVR